MATESAVNSRDGKGPIAAQYADVGSNRASPALRATTEAPTRRFLIIGGIDVAPNLKTRGQRSGASDHCTSLLALSPRHAVSCENPVHLVKITGASAGFSVRQGIFEAISIEGMQSGHEQTLQPAPKLAGTSSGLGSATWVAARANLGPTARRVAALD